MVNVLWTLDEFTEANGATRISALVLLVMTVLMVIYATPATLWATQIYWIAILLVLRIPWSWIG